MHAHRAACTALLALAVLTAGCSNNGSDNKAQTKPIKATSTKAPTKATPTPGPLQFGSGSHWSDTDDDGRPISGTTTVLSYTQPAKDVDLPDEAADFKDPVWAVLEVKVCVGAKSSAVAVSQAPWALGFRDDTRLNAPNISGSGVAKPEYATDGATVNPDSCLRGKITYSVERGTRPDRIVYGATGRDTVEWAIPKA
ncbi:hypothetical protein ACFVW9_15120 [Streptomyces sp. NPDC058217]|uniref:hypothetical protein n=1 Tax=Streptomyces sp. NPDC058217 TaxID=3346384 RepID=UPI0036E90531